MEYHLRFWRVFLRCEWLYRAFFAVNDRCVALDTKALVRNICQWATRLCFTRVRNRKLFLSLLARKHCFTRVICSSVPSVSFDGPCYVSEIQAFLTCMPTPLVVKDVEGSSSWCNNFSPSLCFVLMPWTLSLIIITIIFVLCQNG